MKELSFVDDAVLALPDDVVVVHDQGTEVKVVAVGLALALVARLKVGHERQLFAALTSTAPVWDLSC